MAVYAPRRRARAWLAPHAVAMVAVAVKEQKGGLPVVREGMKKDPAIVPGEGARAIDTFHAHFITRDEFAQAFDRAKEFLINQYGKDGREEFLVGYMTLLSYLSGYAGNMPLAEAVEGARKILYERYGLKYE